MKTFSVAFITLQWDESGSSSGWLEFDEKLKLANNSMLIQLPTWKSPMVCEKNREIIKYNF